MGVGASSFQALSSWQAIGYPLKGGCKTQKISRKKLLVHGLYGLEQSFPWSKVFSGTTAIHPSARLQLRYFLVLQLLQHVTVHGRYLKRVLYTP